MTEPSTHGQRFAAAHGNKTSFRDSHEKRSYLRAMAIAAHIVDDPAAVATGEEFLERHMRADPHQARYYRLWKSTLLLNPERIAAMLLEDSEQGAELRASAPVFVVLEDKRAFTGANLR